MRSATWRDARAKLMRHLVLQALVTCIAGQVAAAQPGRDLLQKAVSQLQGNATNDALRERIIQIALELKPSPAIPEEAERRMVRGRRAFVTAKVAADYEDAAREFEQAALAAPWYGDAYFNLGKALDKAERHDDALRNLHFAQLAMPGDGEVRTLIYEVEYNRDRLKKNGTALQGLWGETGLLKSGSRESLPCGPISQWWQLRQPAPGHIEMWVTRWLGPDNSGCREYAAGTDDILPFAGKIDAHVAGQRIDGRIHVRGYKCPDHDYDVVGEVSADAILMTLKFVLQYEQLRSYPNPCGRIDNPFEITLELRRQ